MYYGGMKLKALIDYIKSLPPDEREKLAEACGTSLGHLRNVSYGQRPCAPELAVSLERHTGGAVHRRAMRPNDWSRIWPELIGMNRRGRAA